MSTSDPGQPGFGAEPPAQPGYGQQPAGHPGYGQPQQPPPPPPPYASPPPAYNAPQHPAAGAPGTSLSFDWRKIGMYDAGIAAAAVLFLIALLLPWVHASIDGSIFGGSYSGSENGFRGLLVFAWILFLAAAVWVLLPAFGVSIKTGFPRSLVTLVLVGLALLFTIIRFFDALGGGGIDFEGVDAGASYGAYLGLLIALAAGALAVMSFLAEQRGAAQPSLRAQHGGGSSSRAQTATPTATWTPPGAQAPQPTPWQPPPAPPMQQPPPMQPPPMQGPPMQGPPAQMPPPAPYQAPPAQATPAPAPYQAPPPDAPYQAPPAQPPYQPPAQ